MVDSFLSVRMNNAFNIQELRDQIDALDTALIGIIAKRMQTVTLIAERKKQHNIPVFQPEREKELFEHRTTYAKKLGLSEEMIIDIFTLLLEESRKTQSRKNASAQ